jgi:hypothetical protein
MKSLVTCLTFKLLYSSGDAMQVTMVRIFMLIIFSLYKWFMALCEIAWMVSDVGCRHWSNILPIHRAPKEGLVCSLLSG